MVKRFIIPALIGIILGLGSNYFNNEIVISFLSSISTLILNTLLILSPFIIFISVVNAINGIKDNYCFYFKLFFLIIIPLFIFGVFFFYLIKLIYPYILSNNLDLKDFNLSNFSFFYFIEVFSQIIKKIKSFCSTTLLPIALFSCYGLAGSDFMIIGYHLGNDSKYWLITCRFDNRVL